MNGEAETKATSIVAAHQLVLPLSIVGMFSVVHYVVFLVTSTYLFEVVSSPSICFFSAINCGDPGTPTNGQHSLSSTTYNSVVTYTCDVGYTLQGSNNRTCQSDGQWSGSVPQCSCMLNEGLFLCYGEYAL